MKKITLIALTFLYALNSYGQTADYIIRHGKLIDGMGNQWQYKDVAITKDKIVAIGNLQNWKGVREIDAKGLIISPGFIDVHGHIENAAIRNPLASNFIYDGVTTVITGNCGGSMEDLKKYRTGRGGESRIHGNSIKSAYVL